MSKARYKQCPKCKAWDVFPMPMFHWQYVPEQSRDLITDKIHSTCQCSDCYVAGEHMEIRCSRCKYIGCDIEFDESIEIDDDDETPEDQ